MRHLVWVLLIASTLVVACSGDSGGGNDDQNNNQDANDGGLNENGNNNANTNSGPQLIYESALETVNGSVNYYGAEVALSGDVALVAHAGDYPTGTPPFNQGERELGSVSVFRFQGGAGWIEEQKLFVTEHNEYTAFGLAVALTGDKAVVTIAGDSDKSRDGVAYLYEYDGTQWLDVQSITTPSSFTSFSEAALDGNRLALVVPKSSLVSNATIYTYLWDGEAWQEEDVISAAAGEDLGGEIDLDGEWMVVGDPGYDDVEGAQSNVGAVHVFKFNGENWVKIGLLQAPELVPSSLGGSLDLDGAHLIAGAALEGYPTEGYGAAYIFSRSGDEWTFSEKLLPPGTETAFGWDVVLSGQTALVGSVLTEGIKGGVVHPFQQQADDWVAGTEVEPSDSTLGDNFGRSMALEDSRALIGASDNMGGAAYVFEFSVR